MADRFFSILTYLILAISGVLLCSSVLNLFIEFNPAILKELRMYAGAILLFMSLLLAGLNLALTSHPLYEYWVVVLAGSIIGACYIT